MIGCVRWWFSDGAQVAACPIRRQCQASEVDHPLPSPRSKLVIVHDRTDSGSAMAMAAGLPGVGWAGGGGGGAWGRGWLPVGGGGPRVAGVGSSCCLVLLSVCVLLAGQCAHGCGPQADATRDTCPAPSPRKRFSPPEPRSAGTGTTLRATAYLARVPAFLAPAGDRPAFGSRFPAEVGVRCANQRGVLRRLELLTSRARM